MITNTGDIYSKNIINENNITVNDKIRLNGENGKIEKYKNGIWIELEYGVGKTYPGSINGEIFNDYTLNIASGDYSHAEGYNTRATNEKSHAEGGDTEATGGSSHAEGGSTHAEGMKSHAEGGSTHAKGTASHAEGYATYANSSYSHAEGNTTIAGTLIIDPKNLGQHAEGDNTTASGFYGAHSEGKDTVASGNSSHAGGLGTIASQPNETVIGQYNINETGQTTNKLFVIGNGSSINNRNDAFIVDTSGNTTIAGNTTINGNLVLGNFTISIINGALTIE